MNKKTLLMLGITGTLIYSCQVFTPTRVSYNYFNRTNDKWSGKIADWQRRANDNGQDFLSYNLPTNSYIRSEKSDIDNSLDPRAKYLDFLENPSVNEKKDSELLGILSEWIQTQRKQHYIPDGMFDHWATLEETLDSNGDDCDGLATLPYDFLLRHGFSQNEVYQGLIYIKSYREHHMVTFWFEEKNDPWVIDPTRVVTDRVKRMSEIKGIVPIKIFSKDEEYTVKEN